MVKKLRMMVIVAVDSKGMNAGFATMTEKSWNAWKRGKIYPNINDAFGLMYGNAPDHVDTWVTWDAVEQHLAECDGKIVTVNACLAY